MDTILIVVYDILNYVTFPVVYDLTGRESQICLILNMAGLVILAVLIILTITKLKQSKLASLEQDHMIV